MIGQWQLATLARMSARTLLTTLRRRAAYRPSDRTHASQDIDRYNTYIIITDRMPRASTCIPAIKSQPVWPICSLSRSRQRKAHSTSGEVRSQPAEAKSAVFRDSSTHDHPCSIEHIGRGTQAAISSADEPQTTPGSAASLYRLPTAGGRCALLLNEHGRFFHARLLGGLAQRGPQRDLVGRLVLLASADSNSCVPLLPSTEKARVAHR